MLTCCKLYCECRDRVGSVPLRVILPKYFIFVHLVVKAEYWKLPLLPLQDYNCCWTDTRFLPAFIVSRLKVYDVSVYGPEGPVLFEGFGLAASISACFFVV